MSDLETFAAFAEELAKAARAEALRWDEREWGIEDKSQGAAFDPVTKADRAVERVLRDLIEARWPEHGIAGEEFAVKPAAGRYSWSLDPIDGTRSFICGVPTWTVLIALLEEGRPIVGVIDVPRLGERYTGHGDTARLLTSSGARSIRTSNCRDLRDARLATTDPYLFSSTEKAGFERIRNQVRMTRYGLDAYAYARVAAGGLDLVIESGLKPHDFNALIPVVTAAGGAVSNWHGEDDCSDGTLVAAASPALLGEAVALLSP